MTECCGFIDVQNNEDTDAQINRVQDITSENTITTMTENPAFHLPDVDELKKFLRTHESFDDFLAIIRAGKDDYQRRRNAEKVLKIIQQIDTIRIEASQKELQKLRQRTSYYHYRTEVTNMEREIKTVKNRSIPLKAFTTLICAWLITSLGSDDSSADPLQWRPGDPVPKIPKKLHQGGMAGPKFEIPRDYCCHISSEIMEDPVTSKDNFTYERKNIERWSVTLSKAYVQLADSLPHLKNFC